MLRTGHNPARFGSPTEDHRCGSLPMNLLGAPASRWRVALHRKHQLAGETPALPGSWAMSRTRLSAPRCFDGSWRQFRGHRLASCCAILLLALTLTANGDEQTYIVQRNDSLYGIARRHGLSTWQLAERNGLAKDAHIFVGQHLFVPAKPMAASPTQPAAPASVQKAI